MIRTRDVAWGFTLLAVVALLPCAAFAQEAETIRKSIDDHNKQIDALNKEIAQFEVELKSTSAKKQTLQNTVNSLNLSIKKVTSEVSLTKNKIAATQLEIEELEDGIDSKQVSIDTNAAGLAETLRLMDEIDNQTMALQVLTSSSISDAWEEADTFQTIQGAVHKNIQTLAVEKRELTDVKTQRETKEKQLKTQQSTLVTQQGSLTATKKAQSDLLSETKNTEANYQKLIAQKKAQQDQFENALADLQAQLNVAVDQSTITPAGKGVLRWPVDNVRVTQYFGNTAFAAAGAYNGKGHNGIDLAAPVGTALKAALGGTVAGTGNTDSVRGCYSFGKWVMIKHPNGLSTMYSHLTSINVVAGESVATGQLIGYSGETGYATGPHLHFGVYVTSATKILKLGEATKSTTPCANATMPVAPLEGYLNPMNYL